MFDFQIPVKRDPPIKNFMEIGEGQNKYSYPLLKNILEDNGLLLTKFTINNL